MATYDAFISYSHARDKPIAAAMQSLLQSLGKPWYRRRALTIFRDDACLAATPTLWPAIEVALSQSRYLVLLASPQAAKSQWVTREVEYWLKHKSVNTILIAVTAGRLEWDQPADDFVWNEFTPLPRVLKTQFRAEPKWVELHSFRRRSMRSSSRFAELGATLAAAIYGVPKDDLLSKEVSQQRRAMMLASATAGVMMVLGATSAWYWHDAVEAHQVATTRSNEIQAQQIRSERTILSAARTANTLIRELAAEFRERKDLPSDFVRKLLYRAQYLQDQLTETAAQAPDLMRDNLMVLAEIAAALQVHGDTEGALTVAQRSVTLATRLSAASPLDVAVARELAASHDSLGEILLASRRREEALAAFRAATAVRERALALDPGNAPLQEELVRGRQRIAGMSG